MNQDKTFTKQLDEAYAEATRPKPVPFYERKISLLVGKIADLEEEIQELRAALEEIATRTTRELAAHSARIARATLDGRDWR